MPQPIWNDMMRGKVPWNLDEFVEVLQWYRQLNHTPKDDWSDLERYRFDLAHEGRVASAKPNQFLSLNQVGAHLAQKYHGTDLIAHHGFRFHKILDFQDKYRARLFRDGFARECDDEVYEIRGQVLEALCVLPYTRVKVFKSEKRYEFSYKRVIAKAQELIAEQGDEDE